MCNGIIEAGAELAGVYDPDPAKVANFQKTFPDARAVASEAAILKDPSIHLIASAAVPSDRCGLGLRMMDHAKDYFTDKPPFTMLDQIALARKKVAETNRKYAVYYSERLHVEAAVFTETLIADGAIGSQVKFPQSRRRLGQGLQPGDGRFCRRSSVRPGTGFRNRVGLGCCRNHLCRLFVGRTGPADRAPITVQQEEPCQKRIFALMHCSCKIL